ncbi:MAG: DUF1015 domain-containing protein [Chloroflexota bacterium]
MPELFPFRALRYDASAVPDLSAVLCPPYDVISEAERRRLAAHDARNAVHVELPVAGDQGGSPYEAAAQTFAAWIADGALQRDDRPLIYAYEQVFRAADGSDVAARGFFCRLRLEPYEPGSTVRPHEATMSGPKEDRFRLMSAVKANLSPVLFLYEDGDLGQTAEALMSEIASGPPAVEAMGPGGLANRLWLADPAESDSARELLRIAGDKPVTIADGHHRYETALRYRDQAGPSGAADHVLALMYEAQSGGLSLLPWHRVLTGVDGAALVSAASDWFSVTPCTTAQTMMVRLSESESTGARPRGMIGLWTRAGGALLEVDVQRVANLLSSDASETLRWLDVSLLSATLSRMIGTTSEKLAADGRLTYLSDAAQAVAQVEAGEADAAFILRPTLIDDVLSVAAAGEHMPAKSTFFHPKAATGLVFNPLAD